MTKLYNVKLPKDDKFEQSVVKISNNLQRLFDCVEELKKLAVTIEGDDNNMFLNKEDLKNILNENPPLSKVIELTPSIIQEHITTLYDVRYMIAKSLGLEE